MKNLRLPLVAAAFAVAALVPASWAEVKLPAIVGPGMVLQQGREVPVWGWAAPGEKVAVTFAGQTKTTEAGSDGKWQVKLDPLTASKEGRPLTIAGQNTITLANVLVGEVWVCSGQSNMQMGLRSAAGGRAAVNEANQPLIRLFTIEPTAAMQPREDSSGKWEVCSPETVADFSAVGYFFGNALQEALDVPVGLINTSWGGQSIEGFLPRAALTGDSAWSKGLAGKIDHEVRNFKPEEVQKRYADALAKWEESMAAYSQARKDGTAKGQAPKKPSAPEKTPGAARLYNGMIAPLIPLGIRGVIWYQGESNRSDGMLYAEKMKTLISGWRTAWGQGDFPFLFVQLAPCKYAGDRNAADEPVSPPSAEIRPSQKFAFIRQAQLESLKIPQTGMAVTLDLDGPSLHPARKREVGERLASWALANTYGKKDLVYSGPLFKEAKEEGAALRVSFDHAGSGLASKDNKDLIWFEVAGADNVYFPAKAKIEGAELLVSSDQVAVPKFVRYAWDEIAMPNLMNKEGLPASPFTNEPLTSSAPGESKK